MDSTLEQDDEDLQWEFPEVGRLGRLDGWMRAWVGGDVCAGLPCAFVVDGDQG